MHVWLVSYGEPLAHFDPRARPQRAGLLAQHLRARGHEVTWWTSTFDHGSHRHHVPADTEEVTAAGVRLALVHSCGYRRNLSARRVIDHAQVAVRFGRLARRARRPDVVLASMPPIELAVQATRVARELDVPALVDVRDLWPDVFVDVAPGWARPWLGVPVRAWRRQLAGALASATGILALSDGYLGWALQRAGRSRGAHDGVFHVTYPDRPSEPADAPAERLELARWRALGVRGDDGVINCCFFGGLGAVSNLDVILAAAARPAVRARPLRFVICGAGAQLERVRARAARLPNVVAPGHVSFPAIRALASISAVGIAPYRAIDNFRLGIPNKAVEYLALGLGVLWGVPDGELAELLPRAGCGLSFDSASPASLEAALLQLASDPERLRTTRAAARALYEARFGERDVLGRYCAHLETVARA